MTIKLHEFCRRMQIPSRDARYVLERGHVPAGVEKKPATGNHRQFGPAQAMWLAIVLKLKTAGMQTGLAATVANYAADLIRGTTQNLNWDGQFHPAQGRFHTEHEYFLEVGDRKYIRMITSANPSDQGTPWQLIGKSLRPAKDAEPYVVVRIDLALIAKKLAQCDWENAD